MLSKDGIIIEVASSLITVIISSITFFIFGYLCHHYRQKQRVTPPIPVVNQPPVYENVLPKQNLEQNLEMKENIAYGPIAIVSLWIKTIKPPKVQVHDPF